MTPDELIRAVRDAVDRTEQIAREAGGSWRVAIVYGTVFDDDAGRTVAQGISAAVAEHIALHDPANVLRAVAADRKLLEEYVETHSYYLAHPNSPYGPVVGLRTAVESMAARYGITTEEDTDG